MPPLPPFCEVYKSLIKIREQCDYVIQEYGGLYPKGCGLCAIASVALFEELNLKGIKAKYVINRATFGGHSYLVLNDNFILDVTATQFGLGKIVFSSMDIIGLRKIKRQYFYSTIVLYTTQEFLYHLDTTGWTVHEKPHTASKLVKQTFNFNI